MKILLASPRGFCAGVDRAIRIVDLALEKYGAPIYVRHEIVHNKHVVADFTKRGVIFVDDVNTVPEGETLIFSAHGVSKKVVADAKNRNLNTIDATCPLVTKVHNEAQIFERKETHILLIGHKGHVEVEGTMGQVGAENVTLVETPEDARNVIPPEGKELAILTQTTLSVDETAETIGILQERFPHLHTPKKQDICYATQNRQDAVKLMADKCDVMFVVGSVTSSNSNRLREVAEKYGTPMAYLIDGPDQITTQMTQGAKVIGITAGASAPEHLVKSVINALNPSEVETINTVQENMYFKEPPI